MTPHPVHQTDLLTISHRTSPDPAKPYINDTSSYLDLSPLYGHDEEAQMKVRRQDGTGRLYEDVFSENRLLLMPPQVSALLVLFSRNHNVRILVSIIKDTFGMTVWASSILRPSCSKSTRAGRSRILRRCGPPRMTRLARTRVGILPPAMVKPLGTDMGTSRRGLARALKPMVLDRRSRL